MAVRFHGVGRVTGLRVFSGIHETHWKVVVLLRRQLITRLDEGCLLIRHGGTSVLITKQDAVGEVVYADFRTSTSKRPTGVV